MAAGAVATKRRAQIALSSLTGAASMSGEPVRVYPEGLQVGRDESPTSKRRANSVITNAPATRERRASEAALAASKRRSVLTAAMTNMSAPMARSVSGAGWYFATGTAVAAVVAAGQGVDSGGEVELDGTKYEFKLHRGATYVVSWCPMGEQIDGYASEHAMAARGSVSSHTGGASTWGPQCGGRCDLYAYPMTTFLAEDNVVLTAAVSGALLDFMNRLLLRVFGNVRFAPRCAVTTRASRQQRRTRT